MSNRNMGKRMSLCLILFSLLCGGLSTSATAVTLSAPASANSMASDERQLRGDFLGFSDDGKLVTSVGTFTVPASAEVIDRRESGSEKSAQKAQVAMKFKGDSLVEITIY